jgi:hypothetical protein
LFKADKVFKSGIDTNERDFKVWTHDDWNSLSDTRMHASDVKVKL